MSRTISFLTKVHQHSFAGQGSDEFGSAEVLDRADVRRSAEGVVKEAIKKVEDRIGGDETKVAKIMEGMNGAITAVADGARKDTARLAANVVDAFRESVETVLLPHYKSLASVLETALAPVPSDIDFRKSLTKRLDKIEESLASFDARLGRIETLCAHSAKNSPKWWGGLTFWKRRSR